MNTPPQDVQDACAVGLAEWQRLNVGGTKKAVGFATACAAGLPFDADVAEMVMEAHVTLAAHAGRDEPTAISVSRLLWGGSGGWRWAEQALAAADAPNLEPVAAEADREPLQPMMDELFAIDEAAAEALEAAFWVAYRQALRATGRTVQAAANRTRSKQWQADAGFVGDELRVAREAITSAHPFEKWRRADVRIHAALDVDLERAVEDALTDFADTAFGVLTASALSAADAVAAGLGVERTALVVPDERTVSDAVVLLRAALLEWIRARLAGDRPGVELPELSVPPALFRTAIGTVGGVAAIDDGAPVDNLGEITGQSIASNMVARAAAAITSGSIVSRLFSRVETQRRIFWWYGSRSTRETPNEDHYKAARREYTAPQLAALDVFPGQWPDCRCRAIPLPPKVTRR